jgi:HSP20 family protein
MSWSGANHHRDNGLPVWAYFDPTTHAAFADGDNDFHSGFYGPPGPPGSHPFGRGFPFGEGFEPWAGRGPWGGRGRGRWGRHWNGHRERRGGADGPQEDGAATDGEDVRMMGENEPEKEKGQDKEKGNDNDAPYRDDSETLTGEEHPDPPESVPLPHRPHPHHHHHHGPRGFRGRRGGPCGGGRHGMRGPPPPPPPFGPWAHGRLPPWLQALGDHPMARQLQDFVENLTRGGADNNNNNNDTDFSPPVDVFTLGEAGGWVLHVALPGAKKEDVGVHWDVERRTLAVSGVVHRPGDEAFLAGLVSGERRVGLFRREVRLPPVGAGPAADAGRDADVDADGITARMEDGVLVITVPAVEKEWTEVKKVDVM